MPVRKRAELRRRRTARLCRAWRRHPFLVPARRIGRDRAGAARARSAWTPSASPTATRWPAWCGCTAPARARGCKPLIGCRLDLDRCAEPARLPDRPRRLWPAVAAAQPRQDARGERRMRPRRWPTSRRTPKGIAFIAWPDDDLDTFAAELPRLRAAVAVAPPCRGELALSRQRHCADRAARPARAAHGRTILATNDVHYHAPERRPLQDVVTCIREKTTIASAGFLLNPNAERHLKSPEEMARLFERWPHAIAATREFADALHFSLDELQYEYPQGDRARGPHAAAISRASDVGRRAAGAGRKAFRTRC